MSRHKGKASPQPSSPQAARGTVEIRSSVLRRIRQHARSSMSEEICGVLIGPAVEDRTVVDALISGEKARQAGTHVTFTQETWAHIYSVKDSQYPDAKIVGWYHSHPGFGVFLSDHDLFIHRNFFSGPAQVAWVYDPHSDEEGCFGWERGEIVRLPEISVRDDGDGKASVADEPQTAPADDVEEAIEPEPRKAALARWITLTMSHLIALALGVAAGALLFSRVVVYDRGVPEAAAPAIPGPKEAR